MNNVTEMMNSTLQDLGVNAGSLPHYSWMPIAAIIISIVFGIIYCFLGYKAMRVLATLAGIGIGYIIGSAIVQAAHITTPVDLVIIIGASVIFGLLGFFLYRIGVFLVVLLGGFGISSALLAKYTKLDETVVLIIALVIGVILGILSVVYLRPIVIISTALSGGLTVSNELFENLIKVRWSPEAETLVRLGCGLIIGIIGMLYQFKTTRPKNDD